MPKPSVPPSQIQDMLRRRWGDVSDFQPLAEGLASQAFGFRVGAEEYVVRVNESVETFQKDAFVGRRFAAPALPIPAILDVSRLDAGPAFCISRRAPGVRLRDLDAAGSTRIVGPVVRVIEAIAASDLSGTSGFGRFDAGGMAPYRSWKDFLRAVADPRRFDWSAAGGPTDGEVIGAARRRVVALAERCPEERRLLHGDFGSCNALADDHRVTAIIDWDLALFGDPLYEVANLFFWNEESVRPLVERFERNGSGLPQWRERTLCYQLRIGLQEIYDSLVGGGPGDVTWLTARCAQILE